MSHNISLLCPEEPPSREERIGRLLESLNSQHSPSSTTVHSLRPVLPLSPEIHELPPSSDLLPRVEAFLSLIQASNDALRRQIETDPSRVDMEVLDGTEDAYIEMDLGLGVFEQRNTKGSDGGLTVLNDLTSVTHANKALSSSASSSENSESEDSSSCDENSTSSSDASSDPESDEQRPTLGVPGQSTMPDIISLLTTTRPIHPLPHRRRQKTDREPVKEPGIVVVSSTINEEEHQ